jgi:hypothetical protein
VHFSEVPGVEGIKRKLQKAGCPKSDEHSEWMVLNLVFAPVAFAGNVAVRAAKPMAKTYKLPHSTWLKKPGWLETTMSFP